MLQSDKNLLLH